MDNIVDLSARREKMTKVKLTKQQVLWVKDIMDQSGKAGKAIKDHRLIQKIIAKLESQLNLEQPPVIRTLGKDEKHTPEEVKEYREAREAHAKKQQEELKTEVELEFEDTLYAYIKAEINKFTGFTVQGENRDKVVDLGDRLGL